MGFAFVVRPLCILVDSLDKSFGVIGFGNGVPYSMLVFMTAISLAVGKASVVPKFTQTFCNINLF